MGWSYAPCNKNSSNAFVRACIGVYRAAPFRKMDRLVLAGFNLKYISRPSASGNGLLMCILSNPLVWLGARGGMNKKDYV